jgi:ribosome-binding protein aMBF1 (putative translation factor)
LSNIEGGRKGLSVPLANRIAQELSIEVGAIASAPVTTRPCPCHRERPPSSPKAVTQHGAAIRTIRLIRGHTVAELARRLQITTSHLSNVEHQNKNASPTLIDRIAEVLLIDPAAIICHHDHD